MIRILAFFALLILAFCGDGVVTAPDIPIVPPPPTQEPDFNAGPMFSLTDVHGFSAFALPTQHENIQRMVLRQARRHGYNTARICAETQSWPGGLLPKGRGIEDGALDDLKQTLHILAEEDMYGLIIVVCTVKEDRTPFRKIESWALNVATATRDYHNLALEAVNEYDHPRSSIDHSEVTYLIRLLKRRSGHLVSTDLSLGWPSGKYRYDGGLGSDFPDFHPWRTSGNAPQDPTPSQIEDIVGQNGGLAVLSETTAYGSASDVETFGWHLVTESQARIQRYADSCRPERGCVFFFHSVEGLTANGFSWMAQR